jgi:sugar phosphate isomerase/epimerase
MELGIFSRTYGISDLEETFRRMTQLGIYHTQFNLSNANLPALPEAIDEEKIIEIGRMAGKYNITIDALSGTFNMIDPDTGARQKGCRQFEIQCKIAHLLNIPIVSLCTGSKNPKSKWMWHEDNLKEAAWDDLMQTTDTILKFAEENGIVLGVETEASNIINTPERARKYLDSAGSTNLKIIMDAANLCRPFRIAGMKKTITEAFDILGRDIVLAHAKDISFDGKVSFVAAGEGILDFKYYIALLNKVGYKGPLVMHGLSEEQVPKSYRFLKEIIENESICT